MNFLIFWISKIKFRKVKKKIKNNITTIKNIKKSRNYY